MIVSACVPLLPRTVDVYRALTMLVAMFYGAVWVILLAMIRSSMNREPDNRDIGLIFGGIMFTQMANNLQIHWYCLWWKFDWY